MRCLIVAFALSTLAADWPRFRGADGNGTSDAKGLPTKWGPKEGIAWKTELPGPGTSSPIVVGKKVFLTCYSGFNEPGKRGDMDALKLHLVCLDLKTGKILFDKKITPNLPEQARIRDDHGYASSTPASDGERVYVFFGKTGAFAFDLEGEKLWQTDLGSTLNGFGSGASPVVAGDLVVFNASVESETLVALHRKTGKEAWTVKKVKESWNTPLLVPLKDGKSELVYASFGKVAGLDPETGKERWTCKNDCTWYIVPSIIHHEGVVYSLGGRSGTVGCAVKLGGSGDATETHRLWTTKKGSNVSSPVFHGGHLYWMNDNSEVAFCADAKTGDIVYEERLPRAGQMYASALLAGGKVYYLTRTGKTFVVEASPKFKLVATNDLGDRSTFNASPAVAGDRLLIRSDRFLYAIGK